MRKLLCILPLALLASCGYSVFDAADDIGNFADESLDEGIQIPTETKKLAAFDVLAASGSDRVIVTRSDEYSIRIEGDETAIERARYWMKDGKLIVGRKKSGMFGISSSKGKATIHVGAPTLSRAASAGSGKLEIAHMSGEEVKLSVAGSGGAKVDEVEAGMFKGSIAGSGSLAMTGTADSAKISISGSGDVKAPEFKADDVKISIAGSGDVEIASDGNVKGSIAGSGDILVHGKAACKVSKAGSGDIHCTG